MGSWTFRSKLGAGKVDINRVGLKEGDKDPERITGIPSITAPIRLAWFFGLLFVGMVFFAGGIPIILIGLNVIECSGKNASDGVIAGFGYLFSGAGLYVMIGSLISLPQILRDRRAEHPWQRGVYWKRPGWIEETETPSLAGAILGLGIIAGFFTPFLMFAFEGIESDPLRWLIVAFAAIFAFFVAYRILRAAKYSPSSLETGRDFFRPGDMFTAKLHCDVGLDVCEWIDLKLRYIRQIIVSTGGKNSNSTTYHHALHTEEVRLMGDDFPGGVISLPMEIKLPVADRPDWTTKLHDSVKFFWMLTIHANTAGVDYYSNFLIPVYDPAAA